MMPYDPYFAEWPGVSALLSPPIMTGETRRVHSERTLLTAQLVEGNLTGGHKISFLLCMQHAGIPKNEAFFQEYFH